MATILIPTDAADGATFIGGANEDDVGEYEESGTPFQGANNRGNDPGGLALTFQGETGNPTDIEIDGQNNAVKGFIVNSGEAYVIIRRLTVKNFKPTFGYGGGVQAYVPSTFQDLIVHHCTETYAGGGIQIGTGANGSSLTNCLIYSCTCGGHTFSRGGGISVWTGGIVTVTIKNITITACHSGPGSNVNYGGGLALIQASGTLTINVTDSTIYDNTAQDAGQEFNVYGGTLNLDYCCHPNQAADKALEVGGTLNTTNGVLDTDPLFVAGDHGDYYLSQIAAGEGANSACKDAGSDTAANLGMDAYTTRTDNVFDAGQVDIGFHYGHAVPSGGITTGPFGNLNRLSRSIA